MVRLLPHPKPEADLIDQIPQLEAIVETLATGLYEPRVVAAAYGLDPVVMDQLRHHPKFVSMLKIAQQRFLQMDPKARLRRRANAALEVALPELVEILHGPDVTDGMRLRALSEISRIAGIRGVDNEQDQAAERVTVHIHLNDLEGDTIIEGRVVDPKPAPKPVPRTKVNEFDELVVEGEGEATDEETTESDA